MEAKPWDAKPSETAFFGTFEVFSRCTQRGSPGPTFPDLPALVHSAETSAARAGKLYLQ
jgi:hypothetical protein